MLLKRIGFRDSNYRAGSDSPSQPLEDVKTHFGIPLDKKLDQNHVREGVHQNGRTVKIERRSITPI